MKNYYPGYYPLFRCIAAACPDSCCQGWDVVVDSYSEEYYMTVGGELGEKLRSVIVTDSDGDRIFRLAEHKKCPFWGEDKLCDIHRELGEQALCATCAEFPRIRMEFEGFTEHTLALACPEAARLILSEDGAYSSFTHMSAAGCDDYSQELIRVLLKARAACADILSADETLRVRLKEVLRFSRELQTALGSLDRADSRIDPPELFSQLEYIDKNNRERMMLAAEIGETAVGEQPELTRLALYYLYRYFLTAADSLNVLAPIRFLILSVVTVAGLARREGMELAAAAQLYSKEIEQSAQNLDALWDRLTFN